MASPTLVSTAGKHSKAVEKDLQCHCLRDDPMSQGGLCEARLVPQVDGGLPTTPGPAAAPGKGSVLKNSPSDHFSRLMQGLFRLPSALLERTLLTDEMSANISLGAQCS